MTLIKWNQDPFEDFHRMFNNLLLSPVQRGMQQVGMDLAVDIYEEDDKIIAEMNLPGIDPEDIDIAVEDGYLKIAGSREETKEEKDEERDYYSKEIKRGSFRRMIALPEHVDEDEAKAEYADGVLQISFPKKEEIKKAGKKIQIERKGEDS